VEHSRHRVEGRDAVRREGRIAGEQLVASVAAERDGDVLASESGEQIGRQDGRVAERLVHHVGDCREQVRHRARGEYVLVVVGPEVLGYPAGMRRLVEAALAEADRERLDGSGRQRLRHERHHRARVDASAQKRAEGHVADESPAYGVAEAGAKLLRTICIAPSALVLLEREIPVTIELRSPVLPNERVSRRKLPHAREDLAGRWHVLGGEIGGEALEVELPRAAGCSSRDLSSDPKRSPSSTSA
jgi:hypothetical protein